MQGSQGSLKPAFSPTFHLPLPLWIQELNHISPFHISIFFEWIYPNSFPHLRKSYSALKMLAIKPECTNKDSEMSEKVLFTTFPSQRFTFSKAGMESKRDGAFFEALHSTLSQTLETHCFKLSATQPFPVPALSINGSSTPMALCSSHLCTPLHGSRSCSAGSVSGKDQVVFTFVSLP